MLLNLMLFGKNMDLNQRYLTDNPHTECAWYPGSRRLVVINNSEKSQRTFIKTDFGLSEAVLEPFETRIIKL